MPYLLSTGRAAQVLALALTLVVPALLWLVVAQPLIAWHSARAEVLIQRQEMKLRMQALAAAMPTLQQHVTALAAGGSEERELLAGDNDATASAALQEKLQGMLAEAGAKLSSIETFPSETVGAFRRIRLQMSLNASWPTLVTLLSQIHAAAPVMLVDDMQIQPALHRISTASGTFDVNCTVFAFRSAANIRAGSK